MNYADLRGVVIHLGGTPSSICIIFLSYSASFNNNYCQICLDFMKLSQCNDLHPGNLNLDKIVSVWFFLRSFLWSGFTKLLQKWMLKPCDAYREIVFHTVIWVFYSFIYLFLMLLLLLWWLLLSGIIRFIVCLMIFFLFNNFFSSEMRNPRRNISLASL